MNNRILWGIDLSTKKIAIAQLNDLGMNGLVLTAKGRVAADRFGDLLSEFKVAINAYKPAVVVVEDIPFVRNAKAELDLAKVAGALRFICIDAGVDPIFINNKTLKAYYGLSGSGKEAVVKLMSERWKKQITDEDLADATMVASYGLDALRPDFLEQKVERALV